MIHDHMLRGYGRSGAHVVTSRSPGPSGDYPEKTMSWAPCQSTSSPIAGSCSRPSTTVAKWFPAELPGLAGEARVAVGEEDLDLADAARVEQQLARRRVAGRILGPEVADVVRAHRDPRRLSRPARLDQLALVREHRPEERDRARGQLLLEAGGQLVAGDGDLDHGPIFAPASIHCPSAARSASVMWVASLNGMKVESTATALMWDASAWI